MNDENTTISAFFKHDHNRLDALFESFRALKRSDLSKAKVAFTQFKAGLEQHIRWEEDFLFPLWEEKTGMSDSGPTAVMRHEHRQIEEQLQAIQHKVSEHDPEGDREEQALLGLLSSHNLKEERVLYPSIDQISTAEECREIFRKIREYPEHRI